MKNKINARYEREREVMKRISEKIVPRPFSGARWETGKEDGASERILCQVKTTGTNALVLAFSTIWDLLIHKNDNQVPLLVLDFVHPRTNGAEFPEQIWVCMRLTDFKEYALPAIENTEIGGEIRE